VNKKKRKPRPDLSERNKNRIWSKESKQKISEANSGRKHGPRPAGYSKKLSQSLREYYESHTHHKKGKPHSDEHRARISAALKGKSLSAERRKKISDATKGRKPWNWTGKDKGYPLGVWKSARQSALERDGSICMIDSSHGFARYKNPDVHHIDGAKHNCDLRNLICLCKKCHAIMQADLSKSIPRLRAILTERYGYTYD